MWIIDDRIKQDRRDAVVVCKRLSVGGDTPGTDNAIGKWYGSGTIITFLAPNNK